jgi:uncharacterized metal-binding protein
MESFMPRPILPLVYSCSGCSSAAQMANRMALRIDRERIAEMSCIAGVGGGVRGLVKTAQSGRPILALDGCVMACVAACLARAGVQADRHLILADYGVKKGQRVDADPAQLDTLYTNLIRPAAMALASTARFPGPLTPDVAG